MSSRNYQKITEQLIKQAKDLGANLRISIGKNTSFNVTIRNSEVEELQEANDTSLSFSVNLDNKIATASTSDLSEDTLSAMLKSAVDRAKLSSVDESAVFPEFQRLTTSPDSLQMYNPEIQTTTPEQKIQAARNLEEICLKDNRIALSMGSFYGTTESELFLALSNGFYGNYKTSGCSTGV